MREKMENKATGGKTNGIQKLLGKKIGRKPRNWMPKSLTTAYNKTIDAIKHLSAVLITEKENLNTK